MNRREKYIISVLELGPKKAVKIPVNPAKLRKYAAMNIIR